MYLGIAHILNFRHMKSIWFFLYQTVTEVIMEITNKNINKSLIVFYKVL